MENEIINLLQEINSENSYETCDDFFEEELIDSMGVLTLISMIEDNFNIEILPEDIIADNFLNVESIVGLIEKYKEM